MTAAVASSRLLVYECMASLETPWQQCMFIVKNYTDAEEDVVNIISDTNKHTNMCRRIICDVIDERRRETDETRKKKKTLSEVIETFSKCIETQECIMLVLLPLLVKRDP